MNRQQGVHNARAQITCRVQGVPGLPTQADYEHSHHEAEGERLEHIVEVQGEFHAAGGNRGLEIHAGVQRREDEHEGANNFRERVREVVVNGRNRGEHAELNLLVGGGLPMRQVVQVHQPRARHGPKKLGDHIPGDLGPIKFAKSRQPYRDRGVQMPAGIRMRGVDTESYGKTPAEGDSEEVIAVPFGASQLDGGDGAAPDSAHNERA